MGEIHMYGGKREEETKHVPLLLYLFKFKSYIIFNTETPNPI
jgi:hypothetical protein